MREHFTLIKIRDGWKLNCKTQDCQGLDESGTVWGALQISTMFWNAITVLYTFCINIKILF